jgi:hypothetical protein
MGEEDGTIRLIARYVDFTGLIAARWSAPLLKFLLHDKL